MKKRKDGRYMRTFTINDKRISFYSSAESEKQAIREIEKQMITYQEKKERGSTFEKVSDEWSEEHFKTLEHYTERRYKTLLDHALSEFKDYYIKDITPNKIDNFLNVFAVKGYATKTIKDQLSILKLIFRYAVIKEYVSSDPTKYIKAPKGREAVQRSAITEEEMQIVKNSIDCTFGLLAYFLMYSGLRKGEALALQYKDIDFKNKTIDVYKSVYHENNQPRIKSTKTVSGIRTVALLDCIADKIPKGKPNIYIFSGTEKPLTNSEFQCRWKRYLQETGLNITAHQLRHTFATILFEADISAKDAQNIMGHSDISTTQNIYTHIRKTRTTATTERLNNYINNI